MDVTYSVLVLCLAAAVIAAEVLGRHGRLPWPGGLAWPAVIGIGLVVAGIGLRAWSIATLGRFFQYQITIQPSHRVVTTGPYRYLRHRAYSAVTLVLAGIALVCDDVWSLVAAAALGGTGLAVRIRAEERQLTQALGAEYEHFAAGRKRLVPDVW
jgi:protein-S-isoprenylcysteine O-methyltransferase Ste14